MYGHAYTDLPARIGHVHLNKQTVWSVDDDEWAISTNANGVQLSYVLAHEAGHALGLDHTPYNVKDAEEQVRWRTFLQSVRELCCS